MNRRLYLLIVSLIVPLAACAPAASQGTPAPISPTATVPWTPSPSDGITAGDSGKTVEISVTSRVSIVLNSTEYPAAGLSEDCDPKGTLGKISNVPSVPQPYYAVRYEGVQPGKCKITNGQFEVTITVVRAP